jgi:adenosine kinase
MATIGKDGQDYLARLNSLNISTHCIRTVDQAFTAQAFITTDLDDNQITAFHPGAMNESHNNRVQDAGPVALGIVAPDGRTGMIEHARDLAQAGTPFIFDPGQGLPMFDGNELLNFLDQATFAAVNDYEAKLLTERTGKPLSKLAERVDALIVTRGAEGAWIFTDGQQLNIPCVKPEAVVDPTGCGDAFRAGLLYGITNGFDWLTTGRLASTMGALKIAHRGGQQYAPSKATIADTFESAFAYKPWAA